MVATWPSRSYRTVPVTVSTVRAMQPLRWGILSTGAIAHRFASELRESDTGELVAVGSRAKETALVFADSVGITRAHSSYEELLADPEVDAVYVATPHPMH